jgi:DNA-binding transcriptional regulator YbjK
MSIAVASPSTDGRRQRGDASRRSILDAATSVIAAGGVASLTHRAAATAAGVPLSRVSYHFPTIDDLLEAAALQYVADFDERLHRMAESALASRRSIVEACTDLLLELVTTESGAFLAVVEVRIALARRGRTVAGSGVVRVVTAFGVAEDQAVSIVAALFGFAVLAATEAAPIPRERVRAHVAGVLEEAP